MARRDEEKPIELPIPAHKSLDLKPRILKTLTVKLKGGTVCTINKEDFDEDLHTKVKAGGRVAVDDGGSKDNKDKK